MNAWTVTTIILAAAYTILVVFMWGLGRSAKLGDRQNAELLKRGRPRVPAALSLGAAPRTAMPDKPSRPTTTEVKYVEGHRVYEVRG